MKRSRREFLSNVGSGIALKPLIANGSIFAGNLLSNTSSKKRAISTQHRWVTSQEKENSRLWDQDRWTPEVVDVNPVQVTRAVGYNGYLRGNLRLSAGSPEAVEPRSVPFGFVTPEDIIRWKVMAPKDGEYRVAVLYNNGRRGNTGSIIEVSAHGRKILGSVHNPTQTIWKGGPPGRPAFRRDWLQGTITLRAGVNIIELRLSKITKLQATFAQKDLDHPLNTWPKRSLHVVSIELGLPGAIRTMQEQAAHLHANAGWLVEGKYGLFVSWVPECYPLHGDVPAFQHYQKAVNHFDVDAFSEVVQQTGASWVIFTTTHGKYYFPGPLKAMDQVLPGRTCKRDLIADLADALAKRGIRLMLYFHPGPSAREDKAWANAAGISPVNDKRYNSIMIEIYDELSRRYGKSLSGWFIDGGYGYYVRNTPFAKLTEALKRGNRDRLVAYYTWIFPEWFPFAGDFLSGILYSGGPLSPPMPRSWFEQGGPYEALQPHFAFNLEGIWNPTSPLNGRWPAPIYSQEDLIQYFGRMAKDRWPLTVSMVITEWVDRKHQFFDPKSLAMMKKVRQAVKGA